MKLRQLKLGEKILFGIVGLICVFAVLSFIGLEIYRARLDHPMYPVTSTYDFTPEGRHGSEDFRASGCTSCHRAMRNGTNQGVDLDGIGSKRSPEYLKAFLRQPEATYETKTMDHGPSKGAAYVAGLPEADLNAIVVFLSQLKAVQGSADARLPVPERSGFVDAMVKMWAPSSWKADRHDLREESAPK